MIESTLPGVGLAGRHVVVTRAPHQADELASLLEERGAIPLLYPCIEIIPPADPAPLDQALEDAAGGSYDWLVITSANSARMMARRPSIGRLNSAGLQVAAIGPRTAEAIRSFLRIDVHVVAREYVAESLASSLKASPGDRVLLPQSSVARPVLAEALRAGGAHVTVVDAYQTVLGRGGADIPAYLERGQVDAVTFTSASTAEGFTSRLASDGGHPASLQGVCLAAIGPVTAKAMEKFGLAVGVMPAVYTVPALVEALATYFSEESENASRPGQRKSLYIEDL
jgi:uroporphyrinogen-III synthase